MISTHLNAKYETLFQTDEPWPERLASRLSFWPEFVVEGGRCRAVEGSFSIPGMADPARDPNYWTLSKQYYALAWSIFTLAYSETHDLPYKSNLATKEDEIHRSELQRVIHTVGFGREAMLDIAHLSCETALKSMLVHTLPDLGEGAGFPMKHDLELLMGELGTENAAFFENSFEKWPEKPESLSLIDVTHGSGDRFIRQRYGETFSAPILNGVMALSKFIHSEFAAYGA